MDTQTHMDLIESHASGSPSVTTRARDMKSKGKEPEAVFNQLILEGFGEEESAKAIVEAWKTPAQRKASREKQRRQRQSHPAATKNMVVGAFWCLGGIIVTAASYGAAQGGGTYVVAWGAIAFGAVQFLRGLFQSMRRS